MEGVGGGPARSPCSSMETSSREWSGSGCFETTGRTEKAVPWDVPTESDDRSEERPSLLTLQLEEGGEGELLGTETTFSTSTELVLEEEEGGWTTTLCLLEVSSSDTDGEEVGDDVELLEGDEETKDEVVDQESDPMDIDNLVDELRWLRE